ncbi:MULTISPECIES: hypothetical protein [unclassified Streptomyces]|uniref:DUF4175 domain-containing protein n=1 Tax=Streptomyces evansiae TaxID=3075535 RepID=A0ABU2QWY2_9ACTN|nr:MULTISPECIES: hypothetical protein [unclassified Streptomyces]EFK98417.1 predicted protein [Streptomyces sp. SPB78]MDT0408607.1 hypothetical protein [Streptomyces sp. DSM 41979]MDT0421751.1 hypothetical protein [Streptomyces sp. DSM 41859]NJA59468.1 hypothetical protein [Streptomyces sp. NEAU-H3]WEH26154.1 hypothetical protein P0D76_01785 [Streptomyces sp. AM 3-1-1]
MLAYVAAAFFVIAYLLLATSTSTDAWYSPTALGFVGLAILAAHLGGASSRIGGRRHR